MSNQMSLDTLFNEQMTDDDELCFELAKHHILSNKYCLNQCCKMQIHAQSMTQQTQKDELIYSPQIWNM